MEIWFQFFFWMLHDASPVLPVRDCKSEHLGDLEFVSLLFYIFLRDSYQLSP